MTGYLIYFGEFSDVRPDYGSSSDELHFYFKWSIYFNNDKLKS